MPTTTTIKISPALKTRVSVLAKRTGRTPHGFMLDAIEKQAEREERMQEFLKEARAADRHAERTGEVYRAADVHAWLARLARGRKGPRPKPWRK